MKKGLFLLLGIAMISNFTTIKPLADDTNEIVGKGYVFHLDNTQFAFDESTTIKTINYSVKFNGSGSEGGFGYGGDASGAGYFGGAHYSSGNRVYSGSGGSGWIENSLLSNAHMSCYSCVGPSNSSAKTTANTCQNSTAKTDCAKAGSGYAKITYLGE